MSDLISRRAAIDYFVLNVGFHDEDGYPIDDTDELRKIWTEYFDGIPSAQPKRGRWERSFDGNHAVCSNCQAWWIPFGEGYKTDYHFCPNCGADMREVTT